MSLQDAKEFAKKMEDKWFSMDSGHPITMLMVWQAITRVLDLLGQEEKTGTPPTYSHTGECIKDCHCDKNKPRYSESDLDYILELIRPGKVISIDDIGHTLSQINFRAAEVRDKK